MLRTLTLLLLLLLAPLAAQDLYVMPYEAKPALQRLLKSIDRARYRIDAAIYSFTHHAIAKRLKNAAARGVRVNIVFDRAANLYNRKSQLGYLAKYRNIRCYTLSGRPYRSPDGDRALMHMKVMVIDWKLVVLGSANWTHSAFGKNYETLVFLKDYALAKRMERGLERMFREAKPY